MTDEEDMLDIIEHDHNYSAIDTTQEETARESARRFVREIKYSIHLPSYDEFMSELPTIQLNWPIKFITYFTNNILPTIQQIGMWRVDELNLNNYFKRSITSNITEGMNRLYKDVVNWKLLSIDRLLLMLNKLQGFFVNETIRGYCSLGKWPWLRLCKYFTMMFFCRGFQLKLNTGYAALQPTNRQQVFDSLRPYDPQQIVDEIKCVQAEIDSSDAANTTRTQRSKPLSALEMSKLFYSSKQISFSTDIGAWSVQHENNSFDSVDIRDFPNFRCSCEWFKRLSKKEDCIHILAVRRITKQRAQLPKPNMTKLRKANRAEQGVTKNGKKQPIKLDKEAIARENKTSLFFFSLNVCTCSIFQRKQAAVTDIDSMESDLQNFNNQHQRK
ncbi:unnamed protein product, partial [Didymodactylos carnosus]